MMIHYGAIDAREAILFLHGHGQTAIDARRKFKMSVQNINMQDRVIFFPSRKWFAYKNDTSFLYSKSSLHESRTYIHKCLNVLVNLYNSVKLIGYSQGACLAIDAALTYRKYIPVLSISGFVMNIGKDMERYDYRGPNRILWFIHGNKDSVIPLKFALKTLDELSNSTDNKVAVIKNGTHWDFWHSMTTRNTVSEFLSTNFER